MTTEYEVDDLSDAIELLATGSYTITRVTAPTTTTNGIRNEPATATFEAVGAVFPANPRDLERLPEGLRNNETIAMITAVELRGLLAGVEPDQILYSGELYQVQASFRYVPSGNFFKVLAQKVTTV
jgi:hypothetical protein